MSVAEILLNIFLMYLSLHTFLYIYIYIYIYIYLMYVYYILDIVTVLIKGYKEVLCSLSQNKQNISYWLEICIKEFSLFCVIPPLCYEIY